ncbi:response regulator [Emticicia sp. C21]|uniref:response regulator n=1 Tax=Emticicia sp. C21 TaxID=2302915 RepID=UPI000E3417A1|nr:response regulator [Emticicia sp. C21]RFS17897.1 response regulator [Emticicia sp. C21]
MYINIVLAEKDAEYQEIFQEALEEAHISAMLTIVNDGKELMDKLKSPQSPTYNVVVLDMNIPKKSGIQCLKEIRKDNKWNNTFSVVLTSDKNKNQVEKAYLAGANLFVTKPDSYNDYIETIKKILTSEREMSLPIYFK